MKTNNTLNQIILLLEEENNKQHYIIAIMIAIIMILVIALVIFWSKYRDYRSLYRNLLISKIFWKTPRELNNQGKTSLPEPPPVSRPNNF